MNKSGLWPESVADSVGRRSSSGRCQKAIKTLDGIKLFKEQKVLDRSGAAMSVRIDVRYMGIIRERHKFIIQVHNTRCRKQRSDNSVFDAGSPSSAKA